jgi:hypothetical protein
MAHDFSNIKSSHIVLNVMPDTIPDVLKILELQHMKKTYRFGQV